MRWSAARDLLRVGFTFPWVRKRLARKLFRRPLPAGVRDRFFDGYVQCAAFGDAFRWFEPAWLRTLERQRAERPGARDRITVWLGGQDRVIGRREVSWTEAALRVRWPVVEFPDWGHYPMIDVPEEWAEALCHALAGA
jgi:pimeloyl-ACP methyl ester carboxylesterase